MPHDDGVEDGVFIKSKLILLQKGDPLLRPNRYGSRVRFRLARQDLEKGGFAGAVGADQAVAVARHELDVDILEDDPLAIGKADVVCADHGDSHFPQPIKNHRGGLPVVQVLFSYNILGLPGQARRCLNY